MNSHVAVFFDLDRTLISANSGWLWAIHERRQRHITPWQLTRVAFWNVLYHLSIINMDTAYAYAIRQYKGETSVSLAKRTEDWFQTEIRQLLRPKAAIALEAHKKSGHCLVLATSSSCYVATSVARCWGFDHWLANEFPVDEKGCLLGTFQKPLCYGQGKFLRAKAWAEKNHMDINLSYFYTDSYSDLPLLEAVGHPCIVAPDPRLKHESTKKGWPIMDW